AVQIRVTHGEARTDHESRTVLNPLRRPVVIRRIKADAAVEFGFGMSRPISPYSTMGTIRTRVVNIHVFRPERVLGSDDGCAERFRRPIFAVCGYMRAHFESLIEIITRLIVCQSRLRVHPGSRAIAFPIITGTAGWACGVEHVEYGLGAVWCA